MALVVGLVVGVGGAQSAEATVLNAVNSSLADKTASISLTMNASDNGTTINAAGTGGIDFTQNALQLDLSMNADGQSLDLQADYLGGTIYESIPQIGEIAPGKSWVSLDLSSITSAAGTGASGSLSIQGNPAEMLRMLSENGNVVEPIGASMVEGVPVQGYSVTISATKIRSELTKLPAWMQSEMSNVGISGMHYKVYIDGEGQLRSIAISLQMTADAKSVILSESLDFSDYGAPVSVSAPPADQTVSLQQLLRDARQASQ